MKNHRKAILYFSLGAILIYLGGDFVLRNYVDGPLEQKQSRKEQLQKKIKKKKKELAEAKVSLKQLEAWETMSLPSDTEIARSLYRTWLLDLVEKSSFQTAHVDSGPASSRKGYYDTLGFSVRGKGRLDNLVRFLFAFYRAGHLHKIQALSLTPIGKDGTLDIIMTIEALALPGAEQTDVLSVATSGQLDHSSLTDYRIISQRDFFGAGGASDASQQAFLTAITWDVGEPEIWFTLREQDRLLKLQKGSHFEIGNFSGTVVEILDDDVILESVGERWLLSIGEPLASAFAIPAEF